MRVRRFRQIVRCQFIRQKGQPRMHVMMIAGGALLIASVSPLADLWTRLAESPPQAPRRPSEYGLLLVNCRAVPEPKVRTVSTH